MATASETITEVVTSWPGVEAGPGRRGEFAFRVGRREIGHLHVDPAAHFSLPKAGGSELSAAGPARVSRGMRGPPPPRTTTNDAAPSVSALLRLNYDRAVTTRRR